MILGFILPISCRKIRHFRKDTRIKISLGRVVLWRVFLGGSTCLGTILFSGELKFFNNFLTDHSKAVLLFYTLLDVYVSCLSVRLSDLFLAAF